MSKELPYFRFTVSEWLNDDISIESYAVKGLFIDICAYYWFKDCSVTKAMLEHRFSNAKAELKTLFDSNIIKVFDNTPNIAIVFLNTQFDILSNARKHRQDAGSKGGKQRLSNAKAKLKHHLSYKDNNKDKEEYDIFDSFRKLFGGAKRGNETEFKNFQKHKDWEECLPKLLTAVNREIKWRENANGEFRPQWKNLRTWINQRCWEQELPETESNSQLKIIHESKYPIGSKEWTEARSMRLRYEDRGILPVYEICK